MSDYPYTSDDPSYEMQQMEYSSLHSMGHQQEVYNNPTHIHSAPNLRYGGHMYEERPIRTNPFIKMELERAERAFMAIVEDTARLKPGMSSQSVDRVPVENIIIQSSMMSPKKLLEYDNEELMTMKKMYWEQLQMIPGKLVELVIKAKEEKPKTDNLLHMKQCYMELTKWVESWRHRLMSGAHWNAVAIKNFHDQYLVGQ